MPGMSVKQGWGDGFTGRSSKGMFKLQPTREKMKVGLEQTGESPQDSEILFFFLAVSKQASQKERTRKVRLFETFSAFSFWFKIWTRKRTFDSFFFWKQTTPTAIVSQRKLNCSKRNITEQNTRNEIQFGIQKTKVLSVPSWNVYSFPEQGNRLITQLNRFAWTEQSQFLPKCTFSSKCFSGNKLATEHCGYTTERTKHFPKERDCGS